MTGDAIPKNTGRVVADAPVGGATVDVDAMSRDDPACPLCGATMEWTVIRDNGVVTSEQEVCRTGHYGWWWQEGRGMATSVDGQVWAWSAVASPEDIAWAKAKISRAVEKWKAENR